MNELLGRPGLKSRKTETASRRFGLGAPLKKRRASAHKTHRLDPMPAGR